MGGNNRCRFLSISVDFFSFIASPPSMPGAVSPITLKAKQRGGLPLIAKASLNKCVLCCLFIPAPADARERASRERRGRSARSREQGKKNKWMRPLGSAGLHAACRAREGVFIIVIALWSHAEGKRAGVYIRHISVCAFILLCKRREEEVEQPLKQMCSGWKRRRDEMRAVVLYLAAFNSNLSGVGCDEC